MSTQPEDELNARLAQVERRLLWVEGILALVFFVVAIQLLLQAVSR